MYEIIHTFILFNTSLNTTSIISPTQNPSHIFKQKQNNTKVNKHVYKIANLSTMLFAATIPASEA